MAGIPDSRRNAIDRFKAAVMPLGAVMPAPQRDEFHRLCNQLAADPRLTTKTFDCITNIILNLRLLE